MVSELSTLPTYTYTADASDLQSDLAGNLLVRTGGGFYRMADNGALTQFTPAVSDIRGWNAGRAGEILVWNTLKTYRVDTLTGVATELLARGVSTTAAGVVSSATADAAGNLYLLDTSGQRFTAYGPGGVPQADVNGFVTPGDIVWTGSEMRFVDGSDRLYGYSGDAYPLKKAGSLPAKYLAQSGADTYGSASSSTINKWTGTGASGYDSWTNVGGFTLSGLAARGDGGFALGLFGENRILVLNAAKTVTQDYAGLRTPQGLAFDSAGRLYVANYAIGTIVRFNSLDSPVATQFAKDSSPGNLAFDSTGQLIVTRSSSVDRISATGVVTMLTSGLPYAGLLVDGGAVLAVSRSAGQMVKLRNAAGSYVWDVFASGLAGPVAVRGMPNGDALLLNQSNNTVVKYSAGKIDVLAPVASGMNALDLGADGSATVAGNSAAVSRIAPDGSVTDLPVGSLANQWALTGVADAGNNRLYLLANDSASVGVLYQLDIAQPVLPPAAGTVVFQASQPMAELAADGSYQRFNFGSWIPPYGGDFRIEMARDGVDGKATNFLHVGPNAQSQLSAASSTVPPGDSQLAMCLDLKGADFTSISRVEMSQVRQVSKSLTPRGMAADRAGNLYVTDTTTLYRTNAAGQNTVIANGMSLAFGLATDSNENFYVASRNASTGRYEAVRISMQGVKTVLADLGVSSANGVQVNSQDEVLVGSTGKLLKVTQQGVVSVVSVNGFPQPRGIAVDGRDNVYVQNESHYVAMVKPDGASSSIFAKGDGTIDPYFEGDGYPNIAADCADNFYIAPSQWAKINQSGEEYSLAQVVPRTGRIALLFDARKIAPNLADIDYLAFDRFGNRLLMWNDNDQSIWQVPVTCGAISVDAHLLAKAGQTLSGASKPPSAVVARADGRTEYVWSLRDVTAQGAQVCFSANQSGVQLGEQRSALDSGFISFQNTFVAGDVQVPLAVPLVRAANIVSLGANTDKPEYLAGEVARVAATLTNANAVPLAGDLRIDIVDANQVLVGTVTQQAVTMAAGENLQVAGIYNAGAILPGTYTAQAVLSNNGVPQASALVAFRVLADASQAAAKTTLAVDKQSYAPSERVTIASRVQAQSANLVLDNLALVVQVFDAANVEQFSKTYAITQLAPGATLNFSAPYKLLNAAAGNYRVEQNLRDADGRALDHQSTAYAVTASSDSGYGLTGSIAALPKQVHLGDSLAFTFQAANSGNSVLSDLPLTVSIVNPALAQVVAEYPYHATLAIGGGYAGAGNWSAAGSAGTSLAAVLTANVGGKTITLAQDSFTLLAPVSAPVKLDIRQTLANGSRVLVLVSCNDGDNDADGADGNPAACVTERAQTIDRALIDLAAPHSITTNEQAFQQALRSGLYNTYWISGKEDKLHGTVTSELREAAFGGDGLLVDGVHDNRNQVFDAVTGIRYRGKIGQTDLPVNLNGPVFEVQRLSTSGRAMKPDLVGSTAQALFDGSNPQAHGPAIISNSYGAGRSMLFAFDLAASLQSQNGWLPVLGASLHAVLPAPAQVLTPGSVMPLRTSIANLADPVQLDVRTLLPSGAVYLDSSPAGRYEADLNRVGWTLQLAAAQSLDIDLTLRVPSVTGQHTLSTTVSSVLNGVATAYGEPLPQVLTVTTASQTATATQASLAALPVSDNQEGKARDAAVAALASAMVSFKLNTAAGYEAAIAALLTAADQLNSLGADTTAVHLGLDRILREAQWRWSQFPAQP